MWLRLNYWWWPPKFCKIMMTSYNSLIMMKDLMWRYLLLITTWTRVTTKLCYFFVMFNNSKYISFSREPILSDSYFQVINELTFFMNSDWRLDYFVFASGFIHYFSPILLTHINMIVSDEEHLFSLPSFFINKRTHKFSDMPILTSSIWYHMVPYKQPSQPHACHVRTQREKVCCSNNTQHNNALIFHLPFFNLDHYIMTSL